MLCYFCLVAWLVLAGLTLADSDTCCLVDTLSNLGSYFPCHDLPSPIGFYMPLILSKGYLTVLSGMCLLVWKTAGLEKVHVMQLFRIQYPYSGNLFAQPSLCCCCGRICICPTSPLHKCWCMQKKVQVHTHGGECFYKPRQSHCCCTWLVVTLLLYKRTSLC